MKLVRRQRVERGLRQLPRPPRRGLIEAPRTARMTQTKTAGNFPGHRAGASLKLECRATRSSCGPANFPGHRAGASLKHGEAAAVGDHDGENFPGHRAGASLKPFGVGGCLGVRGDNFPGHRAGASLKLFMLPSLFRPLGRKLPRPPRRGLIEAGSPSRPAALPGGNFPGHRAGASLKQDGCGGDCAYAG